jgi:hypothetical protein
MEGLRKTTSSVESEKELIKIVEEGIHDSQGSSPNWEKQ